MIDDCPCAFQYWSRFKKKLPALLRPKGTAPVVHRVGAVPWLFIEILTRQYRGEGFCLVVGEIAQSARNRTVDL